MRNFKFFSAILCSGLLTIACSNDDNAVPEIINEEEVITTFKATLTPESGGEAIILETQDLDGDGPKAPVINVSDSFAAGVTYKGSILLLNETEEPSENITLEVVEEGDEHQFFFTPSASLNVTTVYNNSDDNGNPIGTEFSLTTGDASSGTLTFTLRHLPKKPNTGLNDAGGETDFTTTFDVIVQ